MAKKKKYYVVWTGNKPGIYNTWEDCKCQIDGFADAKYKSFETIEEAEKAFEDNYKNYVSYKKDNSKKAKSASGTSPILNSIAVDGACSGNPGIAEYQGVYTADGRKIFKQGPFEDASNNLVEFLAIVHALAYCKKNNIKIPIYSDSKTAISWIKNKKCKSTINRTEKNKVVFDLIDRGEKWLAENSYDNRIIKWETEIWGEIPADFGRK